MMKKPNKRVLSLILAFAMLAVCLAGCGGKDSQGSSPSPDASSGSNDSPAPANPSNSTPAADGEQVFKFATVLEGAGDKTAYPWHNPTGVVCAMYRTLLLAEPNLTDVSPDLAESYNISDDGLVYTFVPNDYAEYNGKTFDYNPEKAKQLLQEANYDFNHTFRILYYYSDQDSIDFMDTIAYYLGEVGMKVETIQTQQGTTDLFQTRNYDVGYKGLSAFSIAEWYGEYDSTNANFKNIFGGDTLFDELSNAIAAESDPAKRSEILKQLQELEQENLYKLPLYTIGNNIFINTDHVKVPDGTTFGNPWYITNIHMDQWEIVG